MSDPSLSASPGEPPAWVDLGDGLALALAASVFGMGFLSRGFALDDAWRSAAWACCSLMGAWGALGWAAGRWEGPAMAPARRIALVLGLALAWTAFQLTPLPAGLVRPVAPAWDATLDAFEASGLELPARVPLAQAPERGWRSWNQLLASALFFLGICPLASRRPGAKALIALAAGCALLEGWLGTLSFAGGGAGRARGALYNPNHHAAAVFMGAPLVLAALLEWRRRRIVATEGDFSASSDPWLLGLGAAMLAGLGGLLGFSRGALLAACAALGGWLFLERRARKRLRGSGGFDLRPNAAGLLVGLAVGAAGLALALSGSVLEGYLDRLGGPGGDGANRLNLARATWRGFAESDFLGLGLGGTANAINRHSDWATPKTAIWTHSDWLQAPAELGLPGLLLLGLALAGLPRLLRESWAARGLGGFPRAGLFVRAAAAGACAALLHAAADFHLRIPLAGFEFLTLLAIVLAAPTGPGHGATDRAASGRRRRGT